MAKKQEVVDDLLDALVWMRRKAKKHEAVDDLIDALVRMRRKSEKESGQGRRPVKRRSKGSQAPEIEALTTVWDRRRAAVVTISQIDIINRKVVTS